MEEELKPTEELKEEVAQEEAPAEEVVPEEEIKEEAVEQEDNAVDEEVKEDRSSYNCSNCGGEGLVLDLSSKRHERCPACAGTGKVN